MGKAITIQTIYQNGQPDGNRMMRIALSTMTTYIIPRPLLNSAKNLQGATRRGIYYLINENEYKKITQIYVGQTRNGITRLEDHNRSKDFWNKAILFLADSQTFTLDMISWLEAYAIKKAQDSNRYEVINKVNPNVEIDEFNLVNIEKVYNEIQFIMGTLGYKMDSSQEIENKSKLFYTSRNGIRAIGVYNGEKFQVLENSEIDLTRTVRIERYNLQRHELLRNNKITENNGKFVLNMMLEFNTPSGASDFVLGGSTNGWTEWKDKSGKTLDEVYRK